jgi:hypothetical protein
MNTVCVYSKSRRRGTIGRTGLAKWILATFLMAVPAAYASQYGHFTYIDDGKSVTITGYPSDTGGSDTIPAMIEGKPVTRIGDYAFYGCVGLKSVSIPTSVTSIGTEAFYGCTGLSQSFNIPSGVTSIAGNIFAGCPNLSFISVAAENPNYRSFEGILCDRAGTTVIACPQAKTSAVMPQTATRIGSRAFYSCEKLRSINIPSAVITIGSEAFKYCGALVNVSIPLSVKVIGDGAFANCAGLEKVSLPQRLIRIPNSAFNFCIKLTDISIPITVMSIGNDAFANCLALKSMTIPEKVTSIGTMAFYNCSGLTRAIFNGPTPSMEKESPQLGGAAGGFTVYYYDGSPGFTSPTWRGYKSVNMGSPNSQTTWLLKWGLPYDSAMLSDSNNDGVSLLLAYALNLNPTQNLSDSLPKAELTADGLAMSFYCGTEGINYAVESSVDMINWSQEGIVMTAPDGALFRTATLDTSAPGRFMRLVVSQ